MFDLSQLAAARRLKTPLSTPLSSPHILLPRDFFFSIIFCTRRFQHIQWTLPLLCFLFLQSLPLLCFLFLRVMLCVWRLPFPLSTPTIFAFHLSILIFNSKTFYSFRLPFYPFINFITFAVMLRPSLRPSTHFCLLFQFLSSNRLFLFRCFFFLFFTVLIL